MRIIVKDTEIMRRTAFKDVAQISAREVFKEKIEDERSKLKNTNITDKAMVYKNIREWQKNLDSHSPETLTAEQKNLMWRRAKQLKDEFIEGMLSRDELHPVIQKEFGGVMKTVVNEFTINNTHSIDRQVAWEKKNGAKVREYKNIMRHLNPDNPTAADVEKFRPRRAA